jgi:hypothetical protein
MNIRKSHLASCILSAIVLSFAVAAPTQERLPEHLSGLINDYTPSTVKGGPYEMRGTWSLNLHERSGTADFAAAMNMETSDYGTLEPNPADPTKPLVDPANPTTRGAHTHHITSTHATVTDDMTGCPALSPAALLGFQINGTVHIITGNGSNAPFETTPPTTTLQVCVTGGSEVQFSNITLVFSKPASGHFGGQAIHGVVLRSHGDEDR